MRLHSVPPAPKPDDPGTVLRERIKRMPKPAAMLQCPRCGGREVVETKVGVTASGGGTKQRLCVVCLMRGERVVV